MLLDLEQIAEEIAVDVCGKSLGALRSEFLATPKNELRLIAKSLEALFRKAAIIRYCRMGLNPESWLRDSDDVKWAKEFLGVSIEQQKEELRKRGYLQ
jgi:hypothetical protein